MTDENAVAPNNGDVSFSIRYAAPADMAQLQGVFRRASLSNENDRENLLGHPEHLVLADDGVREQRTRVASVELDDLFVDPAWMRRGVGRALVLDISARVRALKYNRLDVTANPHAMAFYEAMGFVVHGVVETNFYPAPRMHRETGARSH